MATLGLVLGVVFAPQISHLLGLGHDPWLVVAGAVGLWAQTNYQQLTNLFRAEERSTAFAIASVTNVAVTVVAMVLFVAVFHWGAVGLVAGNFAGTLIVYVVLVLYRSEQLGLEFDVPLFRKMQHFGLPLVPSALALWTINFVDREFIVWFNGPKEVGVYSAAVKIASVITFVLIAFRTAWPAFAYSIEDDREARRTYAFVLTYLMAFASWVALALGGLAPWWTRLLTGDPRYQSAQEAVALLAFAGAVYAGYTVLAIGSGRARRTQLNWVVTGAGALANVALNFWLIPTWGFVGAAVSTLIAYVVLFGGMTWYAQSVYPVSYQWRRVATAVGAAVALTLLARVPHLPFAPSVVLVAVYPLALGLLGFYLPAERARIRKLVANPS
jgi:O-antigen/teichoic acid export membrane protein